MRTIEEIDAKIAQLQERQQRRAQELVQRDVEWMQLEGRILELVWNKDDDVKE